MLDPLLDPLREEFMRRALAEVLLIAVAGGALGCWTVFYGAAYAAESLSHAIFPGLVAAALLGIPLLAGASPAIAAAAVAIALVGRVQGIGRDAAIGVVVTGMFGAGALLALSPDSPPGIQSLLFGEILAPSDADLALAAALAAGIVLTLGLLHWRLLAVAFDRSSARSLGTSATAADALVLVLLAAAVLVAVQGLGSLLAAAALVGPAATARTFARRVRPMMVAATLIGACAGAVGLYASYYGALAAGASVAGCMVIAYLAAVIVSGLRST
jgi:ABC-type Mn2+/Zn2+ transport system permease subunit